MIHNIIAAFFLIFILSPSFVYAKQSDISKYLNKKIKYRNPLSDYKALEGILGAPLPIMSVEDSKVVYESPFKDRKPKISKTTKSLNINPLIISNYFFNAGLSRVSPMISDNIDEFFNQYTSVVDFDIDIKTGVSNNVHTVGGNAAMYITIYRNSFTKLLFFGALNRDTKTALWSTYYGVESRLKIGNSSHKIFFREKLVEDNRGDTRYYGYEYSPFKHLSAYIQREESKMDKSNNKTKVGATYRIRF